MYIYIYDYMMGHDGTQVIPNLRHDITSCTLPSITGRVGSESCGSGGDSVASPLAPLAPLAGDPSALASCHMGTTRCPESLRCSALFSVSVVTLRMDK